MALNTHHVTGWHSPRMPVPRAGARLHDWVASVLEDIRSENAAKARPRLAAGERLLVSVDDVKGRAVVATDRALYHQVADCSSSGGEHGWARLQWELVGRVTWHGDRQTLKLSGLVSATASIQLVMRDGAATARLVRERVDATALINTRVDLGDHGSLRVLARQAPGAERVVWVVAVDDGVDRQAPAVRAAVDVALARIQADAGLPAAAAAA